MNKLSYLKRRFFPELEIARKNLMLMGNRGIIDYPLYISSINSINEFVKAYNDFIQGPQDPLYSCFISVITDDIKVLCNIMLSSEKDLTKISKQLDKIMLAMVNVIRLIA